MVYCELGRYPLYIEICKIIIRFWHKLETSSHNIKLSKLILTFAKMDATINGTKYDWLEFVKSILNRTGCPGVFDNPNSYTIVLINEIEQSLKDQFIQAWRSNILANPKGYYYNVLKAIPLLDPYLLLPRQVYLPILKLTSNHNLPVETGRWQGIPRVERTIVVILVKDSRKRL
jgi:hypothetical protein